MSYAVTGLSADEFQPLFAMSEDELATRGVRRMTVTAPRGFPCRISLEDRPVGDTVLLLNYEHQPADTPFRARHAIFVGEQAGGTRRYVDVLPPVLAARPFTSLRAFDDEGMMTDGALVPAPSCPRRSHGCSTPPERPICMPTTPAADVSPPGSTAPTEEPVHAGVKPGRATILSHVGFLVDRYGGDRRTCAFR